jgi:hypothetical protein
VAGEWGVQLQLGQKTSAVTFFFVSRSISPGEICNLAIDV